MKDFISIKELEKKDLDSLFSKAEEMEEFLKTGKRPLEKKKLVVATLFFEPSTRTRLSFKTAAIRLGAQVIDFESPDVSSVAKGETYRDTIRIIDGYADMIVIRHPWEGAARLAAEVAEHPIINAGDGGNQHPTQTVLDLYTIKKLKGRIKGLDVALLGDLKYARVMRSLLYGLGMYDAKVTLISPKGLEMEKHVVKETKEKFGIEIRESNSIDLSSCDVLYVCRVQKERFADPYEAEKMQKTFRITPEILNNVKKDMVILHPLPKIDEMDPRVDETPHAKYFEQAKNGVPVRMAIMSTLLGE